MKYGKTNVQIVAKWLLQQKGISLVFKSSNKQHIQEILDTKEFDLTPEDLNILDNEFQFKLILDVLLMFILKYHKKVHKNT